MNLGFGKRVVYTLSLYIPSLSPRTRPKRAHEGSVICLRRCLGGVGDPVKSTKKGEDNGGDVTEMGEAKFG